METDIAVIGAGALGLSTALHCALSGRSVVVVDRGAAGLAGLRPRRRTVQIGAGRPGAHAARPAQHRAGGAFRGMGGRAAGRPADGELPRRPHRRAPGLPAGGTGPIPSVGSRRARGRPGRTGRARRLLPALRPRACGLVPGGRVHRGARQPHPGLSFRVPAARSADPGIRARDSGPDLGKPGHRARDRPPPHYRRDRGRRRRGVGASGRRACAGQDPGRPGPAPAAHHRAIRFDQRRRPHHPGDRRGDVPQARPRRADARGVRGRPHGPRPASPARLLHHRRRAARPRAAAEGGRPGHGGGARSPTARRSPSTGAGCSP